MDKETKKLIWETFKSDFIEEGISSPDDFELNSGSPPTEEVHKNGGLMKKLGKFRKGVVWLVKSAVWLGAAMRVYVTLPDTISKIKTMHPQAYKYVGNVGKAVSECSKGIVKPIELDQKIEPHFVIFNQKWRDDKTQYRKDTEALNTFGIISDGSYAVPMSAINSVQPRIINLTDVSFTDSDLTA